VSKSVFSFLKREFPGIHEISQNFHKIFCENHFSTSKITVGADRSRTFKNKAKWRGKSSQNPLFCQKVTFSQKVTFGRQSRKSAKK